MGGGEEDFKKTDDVGVARELSMVDNLTLYVFINLQKIRFKKKSVCELERGKKMKASLVGIWELVLIERDP